MTSGHTRALVTGSSGFIGGHLIERLAAEGTAVAGLDIAAPRHPLPAGALDLRVDLRDSEAVARAVAEAQPDIVYHFAAQASVAVSMRDPAADIETNVLGTVHLARAAAAHGVQRFVYTSTGGALFGALDHVPVDESAEPLPQSIYGASKLAAERYLALISRHDGIDVSVLRPGNVYGPRQDPHGEAGVIAIFARRMLAGDAPIIYGDGSQLRDYVYVQDVVEAARLAAAGPPETCLIATGRPTSTMEVFRALARLTAYEAEPALAPERPGDVAQIALDPARAKRVWGWEPRVALDEGLAATVDWFRAHPD